MKLWRIVVFEYTRQVFKARFAITMLSLPLALIVLLGIVLAVFFAQTDRRPVGYVDLSGEIGAVAGQASRRSLELIPIQAFKSADTAERALDDGQIQSYFVVAPDYARSRQVRLYYQESSSALAEAAFRRFLLNHLLREQPAAVARRVVQGAEVVLRSAGGSREFGRGDLLNNFIPVGAGLFFLLTVTTLGDYFANVVVAEKENRTIEILSTSIEPGRLLSGKILAILAIGLTQLAVWLGLAALVVLGGLALAPDLAGLLDAGRLLSAAAVLAPGIVMFAGLMTAISSVMADSREVSQITGMLTAPMMLPFFLLAPLTADPGGPLAVALSYFPLTGSMTLAIRAGAGSLQALPYLANLAALWLFALGAVWLAGRAFRLGMLRYGRRLSLVELLNLS